MTATLDRPTAAQPDTWTIGAPRLLAGLDVHPVLDARTHLATHGPLPQPTLARLLELLDGAGLSGRGGAGFPLATKLRGLARGRRRVVVNGSESEPASRKDRTLLRRTPHLVLDGALLVASAVVARQVTLAVHDAAAAHAVRAALAQRPDGSRVHVQIAPAAFVSGEARALVRFLDGGPALPTGRRDLPTDRGILVANAETFAQVAVLARLGSARYADTGTREEPGTTLLTVGGAVGRPGVVEIPLGTPLGIVLSAARAHDTRAVVLGGYHGGWLTPHPEIRLSRGGAASAGGTFGAGVLYAIDGATCALGELARVAHWLAGESARQCGPCRFGLPALAADVAAMYHGAPSAVDAAFRHVGAVTGRGACAHPDGTARFVTSALHLLQDEVEAHVHQGGCGRPVLGRLPVGVAR